MSQADIERFVTDVKNTPSLQDELKGLAPGISAIVDFAKSKGYDIKLDEAKTYLAQQASQDLSDDQLDAFAGGKGSVVADIEVVVEVAVVVDVAVAAVVVVT